MTTYYVEIVCRDVNETNSEAVLRTHVDAIASAVFSLDDAAGASFSSDLDERTITFGFMISESGKATALRDGLVLAQTALHAAGAATRGWTDAYEFVSKTARSERELSAV